METEHTEPEFMSLSHRLKYEREQLDKNPEIKAKAVYESLKKQIDRDRQYKETSLKPIHLQ